MLVDQALFRDALGRFPTGVAVVAALGRDGRKIGITVSSFTSLSLDPPMVLFCLDRKLPELDEVMAAKTFVVNVLAEDQTALSNGFAQEVGDQWQDVEAEGLKLKGALAVLECSLMNAFPAGDHVILTGQVDSIEMDSDGPPLVYYRGAYRQLAQG